MTAIGTKTLGGKSGFVLRNDRRHHRERIWKKHRKCSPETTIILYLEKAPRKYLEMGTRVQGNTELKNCSDMTIAFASPFPNTLRQWRYCFGTVFDAKRLRET